MNTNDVDARQQSTVKFDIGSHKFAVGQKWDAKTRMWHTAFYRDGKKFLQASSTKLMNRAECIKAVSAFTFKEEDKKEELGIYGFFKY